MDTTNLNDKDAVRDLIAQQLESTPYACSSLTRLSGGTANFIYRGTLSGSHDSIIIKHSKDYVASNPNFMLDTQRSYFEEVILAALGDLVPYSQENITVTTPRILHFNAETNTQIHEDLLDSVDLKAFLLEKITSNVSESYSRSIGQSLGLWLRSFHEWGAKAEQKKTIDIIAKNISMKQVKFYVNYGLLLDTIDNFPGILEENRGIFEQVRDLATTESKNDVIDDTNGLLHGDFWTGNVLISSNPQVEQTETKIFAIDWELTHIGHRSSDLGQMIAELYETKLFKGVEHGLWIIEGFLKGYGPLSDEMAFRTAIHIGVHLICWGSRVSGWGSEAQVQGVVEIGRNLVVQAWTKNKAWFEEDPMGCLFQK
ncbi:Aminoglycoside phosphotransferase [Penicillium malachiteum]|uniref:Aminoglycoside phosphotransferase n=1 Tax=Penicillium malachiteum TaxID=1324776 RepID=UPI00254773EB|nr:Aminoglycoside phosphotransferase [Penicillium malachiteum]KAJ5729876.1 Aminoglycoside phosphotransferase [Penicillium malachiteum]